MSPSQTVGPGSPEEGVGKTGLGKLSDIPYEVARVLTKGRPTSDWNDETIDDEELRLGRS